MVNGANAGDVRCRDDRLHIMKKHLQKAELNDRPMMMEHCHDLSGHVGG